jgi:hypothetical protein
MNIELMQKADEYHALANRLREGGHLTSADFYEEVAHRADEELEREETRQ